MHHKLNILDKTLDSSEVYADYLADRGDPAERSWRLGFVVFHNIHSINSYSSSDIRIGSRIGRGRGSGRGRGRGRGRGSGSGKGSGVGSSVGSGVGQDIISTNYILKYVIGNKMEIGKSYLIHCGDWHTFVGKLVRHATPLLFEFENVSKITNTNNGDCWGELAAGHGNYRTEASYVHYDTSVLIPVAIAAIEWVGKLPKELELKERNSND